VKLVVVPLHEPRVDSDTTDLDLLGDQSADEFTVAIGLALIVEMDRS
jgi:hypothetical protein